jgi:hypothetical protein
MIAVYNIVTVLLFNERRVTIKLLLCYIVSYQECGESNWLNDPSATIQQ